MNSFFKYNEIFSFVLLVWGIVGVPALRKGLTLIIF